MSNNTKDRIYDIVICLLALLSVIFAILDLTKGLTGFLYWADIVVYGIFIIDYFVRLVISESKKEFFKANIVDLIAILPFNSAFRSLRVLKFTKLLKLTKASRLIRVFSVSARVFSKAKRFFNTNGLKYVITLTVFSILGGTIGMTILEEMSFYDALWWSFVTATTVGYGDLSPASSGGRIIAAVLMLVGIGLIGSLTSSITSYFLDSEKQEAKSEKVKMALLLYDSLNDAEKEEFRKFIK